MAPRPSKLCTYVSSRCPAPSNRRILEPPFRRNVIEQLDRLREVRLVDIQLRRSAECILREHDTSLFNIVEAASNLSGAERIRLVLQTEPYKRGGLGERAERLVRSLARVPGLGALADRFVVKGFDPVKDAQVNIDVLQEQFVSRAEVVLQDRRSRGLQPASAYRAIELAHDQLRDELRAAASAFLSANQR